ncbi:MAG: hypothetical protein U0796_04025 [Gemmatales bacterium]
MSDTSRTVRFNAQGTVTVRQAPTQLLMKLPLQVSGTTLELGLAALRKQAAAAERWLQSLGAHSISLGDPHFADTASQDPMKQAREMTARALGQPKPTSLDPVRTKTVAQFLTAFWDITGKTAEERLVLLDRLLFEAASDTPSTEEAKATPDPERFTDPQQVKAMIEEMMKPKAEPRQAHFLFITRLTAEQASLAYQEAFAVALRKLELLAATAGHPLGRLESVSYGYGGENYTTYRHMEQQACQNILAGTGYQPGDLEIVSEQPITADFRLTIAAQFVSEVA